MFATLAALTAGCGGNGVTSPLGADPVTFLSFTSQPGDDIGRGETRRFTVENASFARLTDQTELTISVREHSGTVWTLQLAAAPGARLVPGTYQVNEGVSPYFRTGPYISFSGNSRGCEGAVGRFTVRAAEYISPTTFSRFHATFEQRCTSSPQGLSGEVNIVDDRSGDAAVRNVAGRWSGTLQAVPGGLMPVEVTLTQSGTEVTGTWSAPSANWSGSMEGHISLGALAGTVTLKGPVPSPTGPLCEGSAPVSGFATSDVQPLTLGASPFSSTCPNMPERLMWTLFTRQ